MKKLKENPRVVLNLMMALVMGLLAVLQFLPFWYVEGEGISPMGYLGFPDDHSGLTSWLASSVPGYNINQIVFWIFFITAFCITGVILCIRFREKTAPALVPVTVFVLGILYWISSPVFRLGSVWVLHLVVYLLLLGLAAAAFATAGKKN